MPHYLQPLLAPRSVALVGATERAGALGSIVHRNLAAAGLQGALYAVNPKHASVFGAKAYARLCELPQKPDLAVIVTPARTVPLRRSAASNTASLPTSAPVWLVAAREPLA